MERVGSILKDRRRELGLSLEDVSKKTKLSTTQLNAIEKGDIQFFKDDLSYLSYFVRYYANALNLNYNEFRDTLEESINAYTTTLTLSKIEQQEQINERIRKTKISKVGPYGAKKSRKRFDVAAVAYLIFAILIGAVIIYVVFNNIILPAMSSDPIQNPIVVSPPADNDETEDPDETETPGETPATPEITVVAADATTYEISGWSAEDPVTLDLKFSNAAWIQVLQDGAVLSTPASRTYQPQESVKVIVEPVTDRNVTFVIGYMNGNEFYLNDTKVELDGSVATSTGRREIVFKFVGGQE